MAGSDDEVDVEVDEAGHDIDAESSITEKTRAIDQPLVVAGSGTTRRARRMHGRLRAQPSTTHPRFELPDWLRELYERQEPPEQILAVLYERVRSNAVDLHTAYRVVNDLGRQPDGGQLLERAGTMSLLAALPGRRPRPRDD
jgi:hypothetical protein